MVDLEPSRKCFRLVGGVLVERTVAEVHPAVTSNKDKIKSVLESLRCCFHWHSWVIPMFPNSLISLTQTLANTCYRLFLFIFIMRTHAPFQFAAAREGKDHPRIRQHAQAKCWRQYGEACAAFFTHLKNPDFVTAVGWLFTKPAAWQTEPRHPCWQSISSLVQVNPEITGSAHCIWSTSDIETARSPWWRWCAAAGARELLANLESD
jgi:hypothetical protein